MSVTEKSILLRCSDNDGNMYLMLPITNAENVDGLDELIDEAKIISTAVLPQVQMALHIQQLFQESQS